MATKLLNLFRKRRPIAVFEVCTCEGCKTDELISTHDDFGYGGYVAGKKTHRL